MENLKTEQVETYIRQEIEKAGYEIVELTIRGGRKLTVEAILDKEGGITLDECSSFNRHIVSWIEEGEIDAGNFTIDVCSPGLDRELKSDSSFTWAIGKEVKVFTREAVEGDMVIKGILTERNTKGDIVLEVESGEMLSVENNNLNKVKLVPKI